MGQSQAHAAAGPCQRQCCSQCAPHARCACQAECCPGGGPQGQEGGQPAGDKTVRSRLRHVSSCWLYVWVDVDISHQYLQQQEVVQHVSEDDDRMLSTAGSCSEHVDEDDTTEASGAEQLAPKQQSPRLCQYTIHCGSSLMMLSLCDVQTLVRGVITQSCIPTMIEIAARHAVTQNGLTL